MWIILVCDFNCLRVRCSRFQILAITELLWVVFYSLFCFAILSKWVVTAFLFRRISYLIASCPALGVWWFFSPLSAYAYIIFLALNSLCSDYFGLSCCFRNWFCCLPSHPLCCILSHPLCLSAAELFSTHYWCGITLLLFALKGILRDRLVFIAAYLVTRCLALALGMLTARIFIPFYLSCLWLNILWNYSLNNVL